MKKNRPDFSNYLAHFTSNRQPVGKADIKNPVKDKAKGHAITRLINILNEKEIVASTMPWTKSHAVCFTECPWTSLIDHTTAYSPFGLGFSKPLIFLHVFKLHFHS